MGYSEKTLLISGNDYAPTSSTEGPKLLAKKSIKPKPHAIPSLAQKPFETESELRKKALAKLMDGTTILSANFTGKYKLGELLGDGAFGFVFTAHRLSDTVEV